ncbi:SulP family inorganic anion transporter [Halobacteriovorax sp. GB3]|uniref:SulP family inorganic anion transporter n=1 Tax=Halobacteriovorax sp. GB3 TaxID=2719615 RepID=UPI00235E4054|nr:SulP family inorganic anion transporter [Halobacteriovorax sp. GB3]MDD0853609.1 SulP family inorganic anion transporter [Halobacteriovorax sp. GB3]
MFDLISKSKETLKNDLLSGLTVALALVPEAVAFSFVAGVDPLIGLYSAFIIGLVTALCGGRPGMISGATGALAVVVVSLVANHGVEYLFSAVVLMGLIQILAGVLRLGKFVRLIPHSVMLGFVNGLAIIIFLAQLSQFQFKNAAGKMEWLNSSDMGIMLALVALTMAIIHFLPKLTKAIPSSLAAILVVTGLVHIFGLNTRTVIDMASVGGGLPQFHLPSVPFNLETLKIILPYSVILAAVGLIESLMTLQLVDEITETRGRANRECVGQGVANVITGFFSGMGGCAMIGQSMINVKSGGRGRASGASAALFLLFFIVLGSGLIEMIPLAALVGVMFMVVLGTFEWSSVRILGKIPKSDAFVIVLVSTVTIFTDLAIAVFCGIIVSALVFAWKKSEVINSTNYVDEQGNKHYILKGPLFFGSVQSFTELFNPKEDPKTIYIDFSDSKVCDYSSIEVINKIAEKYRANGKEVYIKNLQPDCQSVIDKAGKVFNAKHATS